MGYHGLRFLNTKVEQDPCYLFCYLFRSLNLPLSNPTFDLGSSFFANQELIILDPIWEATTSQIQEGLPAEKISLAWQLLLLSDGYTTRNLRILSRSKITSCVISSVEVQVPSISRYPSLTLDLKRMGSVLEQRQVLLTSVDSSDPLLYAISWWDPKQLKFFLPNPDLPIGESLSQQNLETYRDIKGVYLGISKRLEHLFGYPEPFWARYYLLWWNQQPLTLIYEVFSPRLGEYLRQ